MRLLPYAIVIGAASGNPFAGLVERQAAGCSATYLQSCFPSATRALVTSWCSSQGFYTTSRTVSQTVAVWKTIVSTVTEYTSTATITGPTSTATVSTVRTLPTTSTLTVSTTHTRTLTENVVGTVEACPAHSEALPPGPTGHDQPESQPAISQTPSITPLCASPSPTSYTISNTLYQYNVCKGVWGLGARYYPNNGNGNIESCANRCTAGTFNWPNGNGQEYTSCYGFNYESGRSCDLLLQPRTGEYSTSGTYSSGAYYALVSTKALTTTTTVPTITTTTRTTSSTPITSPPATSPGSSCARPTPTSYTVSGTVYNYRVCFGGFGDAATTRQSYAGAMSDCGALCTPGYQGFSSCYGFDFSMSQFQTTGACNFLFSPRTAYYGSADGFSAWTFLEYAGTSVPQTTTTSQTTSTTISQTTSTTTFSPTPTAPVVFQREQTPMGCNSPRTTAFTNGRTIDSYVYCTNGQMAGPSAYDGSAPQITASNLQDCGSYCTGSCVGFDFGRFQSQTPTCATMTTAVSRFENFWTESFTYYGYLGRTIMPSVPVATPLPAKRQVALTKPWCVTATDAAMTSNACRCALPTPSVTRTVVQTISNFSTRTVSTTRKLVSTTTYIPRVTVTSTRTTTLTRSRTITSSTTFYTTQYSTTSFTLAATPSAFYIADSDMHFAEWPADSEEIYYHVQYDFDPSNDEWGSTVFTLNNDQLRIAELDNVEGVAENYVVVGKNHDGQGMSTSNPGGGIQLVAVESGGGHDLVTCRVDPDQGGQCRLLCTSNGMSVNERDSDGVWSLMPKEFDGGFTNYVYAADVDLEGGGMSATRRVRRRVVRRKRVA